MSVFATSSFQHDMNVFRKYVCACSCIYDLFGLSRTHTPYLPFTREQDFEDLYTRASYGSTLPEVVHHRPQRNLSIPEVIMEESEESNEESDDTPELNVYRDLWEKPPLTLYHGKCGPAQSPSALSSHSQQSLESVESVATSHTSEWSVDIVVPDDDLPERDTWDIV